MSDCPDYPNLEAMASGTISGRFREWPRVRPEAKAALAELLRLRRRVETDGTLLRACIKTRGELGERVIAAETALADLRSQVSHDPATCHVCLRGRG
jgi:hypothetical protein